MPAPKDKIVTVAPKPKGHRLATIHGDGPRPNITFYSMSSTHNVCRDPNVTTLKGKQTNVLMYKSPIARIFIVAGQPPYLSASFIVLPIRSIPSISVC